MTIIDWCHTKIKEAKQRRKGFSRLPLNMMDLTPCFVLFFCSILAETIGGLCLKNKANVGKKINN